MLQRVLFCSLSLVLLSALSAAAEPAPTPPTITVDRLLSELSKMPGLEAKFVERKHLKLLVKPLVTKGTLYFTSPGYLARHVISPKPARMVITPKHLEIAQDQGTQRIDLSARKDVKTFVESFARLLAGDKKALGAVYVLKFTASQAAPDTWSLSLTPRSQTLRALIKRLVITGKGYAVRRIRVDERSGDWTETEITEANPKRRFEPDERKRLFGF